MAAGASLNISGPLVKRVALALKVRVRPGVSAQGVAGSDRERCQEAQGFTTRRPAVSKCLVFLVAIFIPFAAAVAAM